MIYLFLQIILTKSTYYKTPSKKKKTVLNFTNELNKNNKIPFLDVLIITNNKYNFTTTTYEKTLIITPLPTTLKIEFPIRYKKSDY